MPSIFEDLSGLLSPSVTNELGKSVGLKPDLVSKGIRVIGPLVTAALANKASTPSGQTDLMQLLPKDGVTPILGNLAKGVTGGAGGGTDMVSSILGNGAGAVGATLDRALGFKASALLPVVMPLILGLISKANTEKNLGAGGIATLLGGEVANFQKTGGETASLVKSALDAGQRATDTKAKYTPVQWDTVRLAPVAAAHMIITADKSGPVGAIKEISAATGAIADAAKAASPASLLGLAFDHDFTVEELTKFTKARTPDDALATVRDAIASVEKNSPADASTFKQFVADVATKVANASKEGGILGFGGVAVSPKEQAALDQLQSIIGKH
jgi:uncharacterized protein DUF937